MKIITIAILTMYSFFSWSQTHVAIVKSIRGEVVAINGDEKKHLKESDLISEGMILQTNEEGFLALVLQDNSQISLNSLTEIKIVSVKEKKTSVIELIKGRIRSLVTGDESGPKLLIKTPSALISVRDGDFITAYYNSVVSSVVLEGEIILETVSQADPEISKEEEINIKEGQFSVVTDDKPSTPGLLNVVQKELLDKNKDFISNPLPFSSSALEGKLVVPQGLSGKLVTNNFEILTGELANTGVVIKANQGLVQEEKINPLSGSYLHIESGRIIPPDQNAIYDSNSKTYIPSRDAGYLSMDGAYIPPPLIVSTSEKNQTELRNKRQISQSFTNELDTRFPANGGIKNINDPQRAQSDYSGMIIRLRDR